MTNSFGFVTSVGTLCKSFANTPSPLTNFNAAVGRTSSYVKHSSRASKMKTLRMQAYAQRQSSLKIDRESFLRITAFAALYTTPLCQNVLAETPYSTYRGPISLGFSFSYPSSWAVTKKAIKTHLSEVIVSSKDDSSTTAGLVVDAVKIDSIDKFGTPEKVGQRVIDVENKKDSVKSASVQSATAVTNDGLTYYTIDYTVDSSRGFKRYVAKATVTGNQLYVFTAQAKVDAFQGETSEVLLKVIDSFNVVKQYS